MLSIGEFSKIAHLTLKTLRYYDEIDLLKPAYIDATNGYRYYNVTQLETALYITRLKGYMFSLEEIKAILVNQTDTDFLQHQLRAKYDKMTEAIAAYETLLTKLTSDLQQLELTNNMMHYLQDIAITLVTPLPIHLITQRKSIDMADFLTHFNALFSQVVFQQVTPIAKPMAILHSEVYQPEHSDVELAIPVKEQTEQTTLFDVGLCAMATLIGDYEDLPAIHTTLRVWIAANAYQVNGKPFEIYQTDPYTTPQHQHVLEVYFPIKGV